MQLSAQKKMSSQTGIFKETSAAVSSVEGHHGGNEAETPALREETKAPELVPPPEGRASGDLTAAGQEALQWCMVGQ